MKSFVKLIIGFVALCVLSTVGALAEPQVGIAAIGAVAVLAFALLFPAAVSAGWRRARKLMTPIGMVVGFLLFSSIAAQAHPHPTAGHPDDWLTPLGLTGLSLGLLFVLRQLSRHARG